MAFIPHPPGPEGEQSMVKGSDLLVSALENEGVEYIFGVPGEETLDLVESLRKSKIKLVLTRHEQAAAFMAATHGRLTGRPGVCLTTLGPGALNLSTGAAYALLGAMPMVMITGQKAIKSSRQGRFQIVDVIATMKPLTKMTRPIVSAASIPTLVRDAFRTAMEERPGPVHLELPMDIAGDKVPSVPSIPVHAIEIPVAHHAALDRAAEMMLRATHPLIMLGAAASRPRSTFGIAGFVRRTGIPFFNTQMGKGTVPGGANLYMGTAALSEGDYVHDAVEKADLIITIGHDTIEKPPFIMGPKGPKVIHVGYTPATVEQVFFPDAEVVGDIGSSLELLADRVEGKLPDAGALLPLRKEILSGISDRADEDRWPVTPQRLVHDVRKVMPEHGILALDNGMYKIWFARNYRTYVANTLLLDNALATMGAGLPSAMMAAMLYPERPVMAICGDGGFMMNSQELETAVRLKLNLVVLIVDNGAYGMIRWKQAVDGFPDFGMTFGNPDFVKYAESYGAKGTRVEAVDDLVPALEAAFEGGGVHVVAVPIDGSEDMRVLIDELRSRKAKPATATRTENQNMKPFTFKSSPNVLFEAGASRKVPGLLKGCKATHVLLVTDKNVRAAGLTRNAEAAIAKADIELTVFDGVVADPPWHVIEAAAELCRERGCDAVLSIGGGSALDTAKLVAYLAKTPSKLDDIYGVGLATGERLPLLLVPTTAGTGSEVTPIAIVTTPTNEKEAVVSPLLIADWAILDPELTLGLPRHVTAAAGIDAMVHAIEAYTSKIKKNPISDQLALKALAMLSANLRKVCTDGSDLKARSEMLLGSMLAGMAFANSPVAAVHALAYPIGAMFHVPHGLSNALVLPYVLEFNRSAAEALYAELSDVIQPGYRRQSDAADAAAFIAEIEAICRDCAVPGSLSAVGIGEADLSKLAEDAMKQQTRLLVNNPRELDYDQARAIYASALAGRGPAAGR